MTMISPYEMKPEGRTSSGPRDTSGQFNAVALPEMGKTMFNRAFTLCALPVSLAKLPFAMRRKRLTGQSQPFLIRSPFDSTGFAIEPPKSATQVERLSFLADKLEQENSDANRHTVRELKELIRDLRSEGAT